MKERIIKNKSKVYERFESFDYKNNKKKHIDHYSENKEMDFYQYYLKNKDSEAF